MDFNLKQWRDEEEAEASSASKLPKLDTDNNNNHNSSTPASSSVTKFFPKMGSSSSSYFSLAQWQELELQALIFRHFIAGASVPPELLHLVNKTLINYPPHHYFYHHPPLLQTGYWGKGAMDPEPGRCRRTDGKKWRCSRDVVAGQKYCERHMHRGRNRSRKPVEFPATTAAAAASAAAYGGDALKPAQGISAPHFTLSGSLTSMDLLHRNPRPLDTIYETKRPLEAQNDGQSDGGRTLRCFFDDWPRSDNGANTVASSTNLSISTPSNPSSDFSLKLGTGNGDESRASGERERPQLNWGMTWETNRVAPMGGPLAEALRSSASTSSPTSVLHRLARSSASETSFVSS